MIARFVSPAQVVLLSAIEGIRSFADDHESTEVAAQALWEVAKELGEEALVADDLMKILVRA